MTKQNEQAAEIMELTAECGEKDRRIEVLEKDVSDLEEQVATALQKVDELEDEARIIAEKIADLYRRT